MSLITFSGQPEMLKSLGLFANRFKILEAEVKAYVAIFNKVFNEQDVERTPEEWIEFCLNSGYELDIEELCVFINEGKFDASFMEVRCYYIEKTCKEK